ncbi:MAG: hypothetical protein CSB16_02945 [Clostridiales bacterium]|nr:MAG: hypothetical protein CSB16_02945 [Clostridiales bacterium]
MKFDYLKYISLITQVSLVMVIPIFLSFFIGKWLDDYFGTGAIFMIIFLLLGVGAAFRNLFKIILDKGVKTSGKK